MSSLFFYKRPAGNGQRLTGFDRYTELLGKNFKRYFITNLFTVLSFLPLFFGILYSILSTSVLVLLPSSILGGMLAGPGLSAMFDCIYRTFRDAEGKILSDYKKAWKQNFRSSLLPGAILGVMLGFYSFTVMLYFYSSRFPGWGSICLFLLSLFLFTMLFSICWPQIILFTLPAKQVIINAILFITSFFWRMAGITVLKLLYWGIMALFFPWSLFLMVLTGFWLIEFTANFIIYDPINQSFSLEEQISRSFPEQAPYYETDEQWLARKQETQGKQDNQDNQS